jgi:DNA-binding winged helix-turn-helix (wHTH) protein
MYYTFGDYILDTQRQELHRAGAPVKLRRKVFQVLAYLLAHGERVVTKEELLAHVWPDQFVGDEALKSCMKALRQALGEGLRPAPTQSRQRGRMPRFVHTVHGQGYRFVAPVAVRESLPVDPTPPARPWVRGEGVPCQAEVPSPAPPRAAAGSIPVEARDGEHKQVTVLCAALAEALTLAVRLGPEVMHHLMRDVLALAQDTVQRYNGTLLHISGEGFLALFGAPVAEELGMRPLQAHCHRVLGTLYATTGRREQAHAALTTAIALYCAMDMTFWFPQVEATLAHIE